MHPDPATPDPASSTLASAHARHAAPGVIRNPQFRMAPALLVSVLLIAACGLVYELVAGALAS
ncbi:MAG TPA: hypothetical protein VFV62_02455, partial [Gaiellaceae bacterium]|nr:hypothetical protein [Gaiellaceae bacterium]